MTRVRRRCPFAVFLACVTLVVAAGATACRSADAGVPSAAERAAIADTLTRTVDSAWDFSRGDVVNHLMGLYLPTGPLTSASGGRMTMSRDTLRAQIQRFWTYVGQNMRDPHFERVVTHVDVLDRNAAVLTATYHIPHIQPNGLPHDVGGAMTLVFARRDGRWGVIAEHLSDAPPPPEPMSSAPPTKR